MLDRLLKPFAPEHQRSGWRAWCWLLFFFLAPVAYWLAGVIQRPALAGGLSLISPEVAMETARRVAREQKVNVEGWSLSIKTAEVELQRFADDPGFQRLSPEVRRFLPLAAIHVVHYDLSQDNWMLVRIRPDGSLAGFRLSPGLAGAKRGISEEEARELAWTALSSVGRPMELKKGDSEVEPGATPETRRFRWQMSLPQFPVARLTFQVDVAGDRLMEVQAQHEIDPAALAARSEANSPLNLLRALVTIFLVTFGIYRFARRSIEKEVAYGRCLILAAGVVLTMVAQTLLVSGLWVVEVPPEQLTKSLLPVLLAFGAVSVVVQAVILALSYGAWEGDLREIYAGKLTSLDSLLTGRWASANVGRSVIFGMASAAWALLAYVAAQPLFSSAAPRVSTEMTKLGYAPRAWLALLLSEPLAAMMIVILGLALPLMAANHFIANRRWRRLTVIAATVVGASISGGLDFSRPWGVWNTLVCAALMMASFWLGDFLAAIVALNLFSAGLTVVSLSAVLSGWSGTGRLVVGIGAFTALAALWALWRGRWVTDVEVRPKYAERIMERLNLQAEVSAAREAQLRLLPAEVPQVPGFSLAAACTPAREVGGDFYDFFPMSRGRLGILVAEGGSTGLASALTIGLAKGFLLNAAANDWTPGEALRRLRPVLGGAVKDTIERLGLGYAILDPAVGQFRFARFGQHPVVFETTAGDGAREVDLLGVAEAEFVGERSVLLRPGASVLMVTDGIEKRLRLRGHGGLAKWLSSRGASPPEWLQNDLLSDAGARDADLDDDLTMVVLRAHQPEAVVQEGVA